MCGVEDVNRGDRIQQGSILTSQHRSENQSACFPPGNDTKMRMHRIELNSNELKLFFLLFFFVIS